MIRLSLAFFQFCGFYPSSIKIFREDCDGSRREWPIILWSFVNFCLVLSLILFVIIRNDDVLYALTPIGKINDILVLFSLLIAHLAIITEAFIKQSYLDRFFRVMAKLRKSGKWQKWILFKILTFAVFSICCEVFVISTIQSDRQWRNFWYIEAFSLLMTRNRHLQHIFFIDIIFFSLEDLNSYLKHLTTWAKSIDDNQNSRRFIYRSVKLSKEHFTHLMEMLICVNKAFCWSQLLNFGQHFIEITAELYWVYVYATGPTFLCATIVVFIPPTVVLIMLLNSATRCIKEEKTALILHDIHVFVDDEKLRNLIMDFSLLIKHSPRHFTARNFFVIDFTLFGRVLAALVTYLLIFISFQPGDDD